ncbi:MAG: TIGR01906 family membrane protein [Vagococcus sp.]
MTRMKGYLGPVLVIVCLLTLSITLTINARWLYVFDIKQLDILAYTILTKNELLHNYDELMAYLNFFWVNPLHMTDFTTSQSGALHFYEVKRLFQLNYAVLLLTSVPSYLFVKELKQTGRLWVLVTPFKWVLVGLGCLIFFMITGFNQFFVLFHSVFFNNDAWIFDPVTDPIITVLPQEYFLHCFILFFVLFTVFLIGAIFLGTRQLNRMTKKSL